VIAASDPDVAAAAEQLAQAFFERPPRRIAPDGALENEGPVLLVGLHHAVEETLAALGLPARPATLSGSGSAQVWTIDERTSARRIAVISSRDADSLRALSRPLPHYGAQSYLTFDGAKMLTRGVWPADVPAVRVVKEP
jgi:hypothetical protein